MRKRGDDRTQRGLDKRGIIPRSEPLKRGKPPKRGKRPKPESAKHEARRDERALVVTTVCNRDRGVCRAKALVHDIECGGRLDVHEVIPRSAWPLGYLEPDNCVLVCRRHHDWIDANPTLAHLVDLHRFSWERP